MITLPPGVSMQFQPDLPGKGYYEVRLAVIDEVVALAPILGVDLTREQQRRLHDYRRALVAERDAAAALEVAAARTAQHGPAATEFYSAVRASQTATSATASAPAEERAAPGKGVADRNQHPLPGGDLA